MRWPWSKPEPETRSGSYTDALVSALVERAGGTSPGDPAAIAALETAAGLWARSFAAAKVSPEGAASVVSPSVLALLGRELCRRGEAVLCIRIDDGSGLRLIPAGSWDIRGGYDEGGWWYRCDLFGPSGSETAVLPSPGVIHCRYATDAARPWVGVGPLQWARDSAMLSANLERRLGEEAGAPVGALLPIPQDGGDGSGDDPLEGLKQDIRTAKGRALLVETTAAGWGEGKSAAPQSDWKPQRFGAAPPATLPVLRSDAALSVLGACGVPPSLATDADGTAARESWRRFVLGTVEPILSGPVRAELAEKLGFHGLSFDLTGLWAHDGAGRATMFSKLVAGGVSPQDALIQSGLLAE